MLKVKNLKHLKGRDSCMTFHHICKQLSALFTYIYMVMPALCQPIYNWYIKTGELLAWCISPYNFINLEVMHYKKYEANEIQGDSNSSYRMLAPSLGALVFVDKQLAFLILEYISDFWFLVHPRWRNYDNLAMKSSTLSFIFLDRNFMHIGGFTLARASRDWGNVHTPSPHIKPEATAGPNAFAWVLLIFSHTNNIKLPTHISIAKYDPR